MPSTLKTPRLLLIPSHPRLAGAVTAYFARNRAFLRPFEPIQSEAFFTVPGQRRLLRQERREMGAGLRYRFWTADKNAPGRVIGSVALSGVVRGSFQNAIVSYRSDAVMQNRGYTTEALTRLGEFAFREIGLHRLEAHIMPRNAPSLRVAEKLGFVHEGLGRAYLNINGAWEDHIHCALINADFHPAPLIGLT